MGLMTSAVKGTETMLGVRVAPLQSAFRGQIKDHALRSGFGVTAPVFHYLCLICNLDRVGSNFSVFLQSRCKWEVALQGLASALQKLLGMSREDSRNTLKPAAGTDLPPYDPVEYGEASLVQTEMNSVK